MSNIFNSDNCIQWWCLLALMLLSFLLGWFLSRYFAKKECQDDLDNCLAENKRLKNNWAQKENKHAKSTFKKEEKKVKAVKTMERSGVATGSNDGLNFASIGAATKADADDLKRISGVGPFIEEKLNTIGIYTFEQISKFTDSDIQKVTDLIAFFPGRIMRDDWRGQAKVLKDGGQTKFSKRVDSKDVNYDKK